MLHRRAQVELQVSCIFVLVQTVTRVTICCQHVWHNLDSDGTARLCSQLQLKTLYTLDGVAYIHAIILSLLTMILFMPGNILSHKLRLPAPKLTRSHYQEIFTMELYNIVLHLGLQIPETQVQIPFEVLVYIFASLRRIAHCRFWSHSGLATGPTYSAKGLEDVQFQSYLYAGKAGQYL